VWRSATVYLRSSDGLLGTALDPTCLEGDSNEGLQTLSQDALILATASISII
jgi:hypothetical protein